MKKIIMVIFSVGVAWFLIAAPCAFIFNSLDGLGESASSYGINRTSETQETKRTYIEELFETERTKIRESNETIRTLHTNDANVAMDGTEQLLDMANKYISWMIYLFIGFALLMGVGWIISEPIDS